MHEIEIQENILISHSTFVNNLYSIHAPAYRMMKCFAHLSQSMNSAQHFRFLGNIFLSRMSQLQNSYSYLRKESSPRPCSPSVLAFTSGLFRNLSHGTSLIYTCTHCKCCICAKSTLAFVF